MKFPVLVMAAAMALTTIACKKDKDQPGDGTNVPKTVPYLLGEWKAVAHFTSDGTPGSWEPINDNRVITFGENGSFSSNTIIFNTYRLDSLMPNGTPYRDTVLMLYKSGASDSARYSIKLTKDVMEMWFMYCTEGCAVRYTRVSK